MVLRAGRPYSAELEVIDLFARLDSRTSDEISLVADPTRREEVQARIDAAIDDSLENPSRLHGWRVQGMFEAIIVALGTVRLIKQEDSGGFFYDDLRGVVKPPDFRIVAEDGQTLFIEVKGVSPKNTLKAYKFRARDVEELQRYAEMNGARLVFAHYWSGANQWTLVDANRLQPDPDRSDRLWLSPEVAMMNNEFVLLGDALVATVPPLTVSWSEPKDSTVQAEGSANGAGINLLEVVDIAVGGRTLSDPTEKRIALFMAMYGGWEGSSNTTTEDGQVGTTVHTLSPPDVEDDAERIPAQGFATLAFLSSMYSSLYNSVTLDGEGNIRALRHEPDPGVLAQLIPSDYWDRADRHLPIWKFQVSMADDGAQSEAAAG